MSLKTVLTLKKIMTENNNDALFPQKSLNQN